MAVRHFPFLQCEPGLQQLEWWRWFHVHTVGECQVFLPQRRLRRGHKQSYQRTIPWCHARSDACCGSYTISYSLPDFDIRFPPDVFPVLIPNVTSDFCEANYWSMRLLQRARGFAAVGPSPNILSPSVQLHLRSGLHGRVLRTGAKECDRSPRAWACTTRGGRTAETQRSPYIKSDP